jgi:hypothetical protein
MEVGPPTGGDISRTPTFCVAFRFLLYHQRIKAVFNIKVSSVGSVMSSVDKTSLARATADVLSLCRMECCSAILQPIEK